MKEITFKGYWPDCNPEEYPPWEEFKIVLFGKEAGDYIETKEEILKVLKLSGVESIDELLQGEA